MLQLDSLYLQFIPCCIPLVLIKNIFPLESANYAVFIIGCFQKKITEILHTYADFSFFYILCRQFSSCTHDTNDLSRDNNCTICFFIYHLFLPSSFPCKFFFCNTRNSSVIAASILSSLIIREIKFFLLRTTCRVHSHTIVNAQNLSSKLFNSFDIIAIADSYLSYYTIFLDCFKFVDLR